MMRMLRETLTVINAIAYATIVMAFCLMLWGGYQWLFPGELVRFKEPIETDKTNYLRGQTITAMVVLEKFTDAPGNVVWTLEGISDDGAFRSYVVLNTIAANKKGIRRRPVGIWINPGVLPGYYKLRNEVTYYLLGGLRPVTKQSHTDTIRVD